MNGLAAIGDNCIDDYGHEAYCGGNAVNVAVYMKRFHIRSSYIGAVGNDGHGQRMIAALSQKGVDVSHLHVLRGKTAVTQVVLEGNERVFGDYDEGVLADYRMSADDLSFILTHDIVHTGLWGRREGDLPEIKAKGIPISCDYATEVDEAIIRRTLPYVNYAFMSREEESPTLLEYMQKALLLGPQIIVATLGASGSIAVSRTGVHRHGVCDIEVVDTMGAGDSYIAGFLAGVLAGRDIYECMGMGTKSAAMTLQYGGAW